MTREGVAEGVRILIAAPFGRDAESLADLLRAKGYEARTCRGLAEIADGIDDRAGVILLTEEALRDASGRLEQALGGQPAWSDIPVLLLAASRTGPQRGAEAARVRLPDYMANVVVLERPLGSASLLSAVASALRSRRRQFDMRDRVADLALRNEELAASAAALRANEARFRVIADSIDHMVWTTRPDGFHDYYNHRWYDYTGVPEGSTDGEAWNGMFHPDDQDRAWSVWRHSLATGEPYHIEYRLRHRSGAYRWVLGRAQALRDESGGITRWFGTCTEIHDLVEAREVLARSRSELEAMVEARTAALETEMANREQVEAALRQSQKMEAVGQLTGGIAHDFNNMLTGVIGSLDIVKRRIAAGRMQDLDRFMEAASSSAQRAARLTERLLAFSRRQSLDARPVDANALLLSLEDLLRRTVSENVALTVATEPGLPAAIADANQLENAVINLAINARDAMPKGGQLTIETRVVDLDAAYAAAHPGIGPGRYVVIAVSDTGVGIAPELLDKIFDPFFTTKPIGQGTGLGLSMVYGFARQSGGQVRVHSRPGIGTAVSIYLPVHEGPAGEVGAAAPADIPEGHGQVVLVVEDDPAVRLLVRDVLEELRYAAVEVEEADAAIRVLASARPLDLMISDVGLPGMNGRQLADVARAHRPDLPILFVTGYAENAAIRAGFLGTRMGMITKPFALDTLAGKVSEMLGTGSGG